MLFFFVPGVVIVVAKAFGALRSFKSAYLRAFSRPNLYFLFKT